MTQADNSLDLQNVMESLEKQKGTFKLLWIPKVLERLDKLERQNQRLRLISIFLLISVFCLLATALGRTMGLRLPATIAPKQWIIKGSEFHLVTPEGNDIAKLDNINGKPQLKLFDLQSKALINVGFNDKSEPYLSLLDNNGKIRTMLTLLKDEGNPSLKLYDKNGKLRTALGENRVEKKELGTTLEWPISSLVLFDDKGNVIWESPKDVSAPAPSEPLPQEKVIK